jgi:hypothetical protein
LLETDSGYFEELYLTPNAGMFFMIPMTACHVYAGGLEAVETDWFTGGLDFDFQANLEGTDYCVGYG